MNYDLRYGTGFVYALDGKFWVLNVDQAKVRNEFVPEQAKHTATINMSVVLERILNKSDGVKNQLKEMRGK